MRTDWSRQPCAKARAKTRKAERRAKSTLLFLAIAFPAPVDAFNVEGR